MFYHSGLDWAGGLKIGSFLFAVIFSCWLYSCLAYNDMRSVKGLPCGLQSSPTIPRVPRCGFLLRSCEFGFLFSLPAGFFYLGDLDFSTLFQLDLSYIVNLDLSLLFQMDFSHLVELDFSSLFQLDFSVGVNLHFSTLFNPAGILTTSLFAARIS